MGSLHSSTYPQRSHASDRHHAASRGVWLKTPVQASDSACFAMSGAHGPKKAKIFFVDAAVREKLGHSMHERVYIIPAYGV